MNSTTDALRKSSNIPFLVVACKCDDTSRRDSQHDPIMFEQACQILSGIKMLRISSNVPDTHKKCISAILRAIIVRTSGMALFFPCGSIFLHLKLHRMHLDKAFFRLSCDLLIIIIFSLLHFPPLSTICLRSSALITVGSRSSVISTT